MKQYHKLLHDVLNKGTYKAAARDNMPGTISLFGYQMRFNLQEGFPIVTTKKVSFKNIVTELLWFLKGDTNIKYLVDNCCNIWNEDAYNYYVKICNRHNKTPFTFEQFITFVKQGTDSSIKFSDTTTPYTLGDCGKQYGWLWRSWGSNMENYTEDKSIHDYKGIDQIKILINGLKNNPMSRRHIITAWNPATLDDMALNACHSFVQFNVRKVSTQYGKVDKNGHKSLYYLDCQLYQRSADSILGVPYNIASYALLTEIIAKMCNMLPGKFIHTFGDAHIYENHIPAVKEQLQRECKSSPKLLMKDEFHYITDKKISGEVDVDTIINKMQIDWFKLENYEPHPKLENETKLFTGI